MIMKCRYVKLFKKYSVDWKYFIFWCMFTLLYVIGIIMIEASKG